MCDRVLYESHTHSLLAVVGTEYSSPRQTPGKSGGCLARSVSPPPSCLDSSLWFNPNSFIRHPILTVLWCACLLRVCLLPLTELLEGETYVLWLLFNLSVPRA